MQFTAQLGGKLVTYDRHATFDIEERRPKKAYRVIANKPDISAALSFFHRTHDPRSIMRIVAVNGGERKTLLRSE